MSLTSTLSTICFRFVIAFFVQERIFVCGDECLCKCNKNDVCDELERLTTSDDINLGQWTKWNTYFNFLEALYRDFDPEMWTERLNSIENKIDSREDLKGKLKETESRVTKLEDDLKNVKQEFEKKMADFTQKMRDVQSKAVTLERNVKEAEKIITGTQEEMLLNTSKRFSNVNKQYRNLKNDFDTKLMNVIEDTKLLKSDVEEEKSARKNSSEENMKTYRNIKSIIESKDMKFQTAISEAEQRLSNVENEVENFKASIKAEKEAREELEEEMLLNTSKRFSKVNKQYRNLKNDFDTKLLNVIEDTKLLKSDVEEEKSARKNSYEENMKTYQNIMSIVEMKNMEFQIFISEAFRRLSNVENEVEIFKAYIKVEKEAREELDVKLQTNFSITSRLNNEEHSEIRKNLTSIERELSNLRRIISLKDTSFYKLQGKVTDILVKMPQLISHIAEEKAARKNIERRIEDFHPFLSIFI